MSVKDPPPSVGSSMPVPSRAATGDANAGDCTHAAGFASRRRARIRSRTDRFGAPSVSQRRAKIQCHYRSAIDAQRSATWRSITV